MRKITSTTDSITSTEEILDESIDLPEFNRTMLEKGFENMDSFEVDSKGYKVQVDLKEGKIVVDDVEVDLQLDDSQKLKLKSNLCKWINFRRNTISMRMQGLKSKATKFGVGFQANIDGVNVKRYLLLDRGQKILIKE